MNRDEKFLRYWAVVRAKGIHVYAYKGSVIFTLLFAIFKELVYWGLFEREAYYFSLAQAIIGFVILSIFMYFFKRWEWKKNEARYDALTHSKQ